MTRVFQSLSIATWALLFFSANAIYFPLSEEKGLERRFGDRALHAAQESES